MSNLKIMSSSNITVKLQQCVDLDEIEKNKCSISDYTTTLIEIFKYTLSRIMNYKAIVNT